MGDAWANHHNILYTYRQELFMSSRFKCFSDTYLLTFYLTPRYFYLEVHVDTPLVEITQLLLVQQPLATHEARVTSCLYSQQPLIPQ